MDDLRSPDFGTSGQLRLNTLIKLRWLALAGQSLAVFVVAIVLEFPMPVAECVTLIAGSAALNVYLALAYPANHRLQLRPALALLVYDALQLAGLLYLTGGLTNPFSLLMVAPVVISATAMPVRHTVMLGVLVILLATGLMFHHRPLPWMAGMQLSIPVVYKTGVWFAVVSTILFTSIYVWRVADEARKLAGALAATELVLQREQHLSALDGLAAAAAHELGTPLATISLVAREMEHAIPADSEFAEDIRLLRTQSERCREILKQLTSLSTESGGPLSRLSLTALVEEAVAPHRDYGVEVRLQAGRTAGPEPVSFRNPGVIYGLGNLVENAVDFARSRVEVSWSYDEQGVSIEIVDDGPGFRAEVLDRIGEPYISYRSHMHKDDGAGGLGLGLFIARSLLGRSGATVQFGNSTRHGYGAAVRVSWSRENFEYSGENRAMGQFGEIVGMR